MVGKIYVVANRANGKKYVGQTWETLAQRFSTHKSDAKHNRKHSVFSRALRKYGAENFGIHLLEEGYLDQSALDNAEVFWIHKTDSCVPAGYNIKEGGRGGKHSLETRRKMSLAHLGMKATKETKQKMSLTKLGYKHTEESKRKMLGNTNSLGYKHTEETKRKMSASQMGNTKALGKQSWLGKKHTEESKRKMSLAQMGNKNALGNHRRTR